MVVYLIVDIFAQENIVQKTYLGIEYLSVTVKLYKAQPKMNSDEDIIYVESGSDSENDIDYEDNIEFNNTQANKIETEEYSFQVLSTEEIVKYMVEFIREVNLVLEMPEPITRILLNHFRWDKQKLLDRFYDGNEDKLFKEAHIVNPFKRDSKAHLESATQRSFQRQSFSDTLLDCEVCYLSLPASKLTGLECGHVFCTDCWNDYLKVKIMDEGIVDTIACVALKCEILVDNITVTKLVKDPKVKLKYEQLITNSFVDCNKLIRWCKTPGCDRAIKVQYVDCKPVTCKCHLTFCFECGEKWHEPINCDLLVRWEKRFKEDSETSKWLVSHTRECPNCHTSIEKNGGCNVMTCSKCAKYFCWICQRQLNGHEAHGCNIYADDKLGIRNKSQIAPSRYLFYHNRYMNHQQSLKFENDLYDSVDFKMRDMREHNMSWAEVQFLKNSVDTLISCRQTLMYTYAFAFFLKKTNQTAIFEDNQQNLESSIEELSGYLERDIAVENLADLKQQVQDKYIYCESRRQALLKHVREGQENDWWIYMGVH